MPRRKPKKKPFRYTHPLLDPDSPPAAPWAPYLTPEEIEMAKKKFAGRSTKTKRASKKGVPAPGQQNLPDIETDRDPELDKAMEKIAEAKRAKSVAAGNYDERVSECGELMQQKDRSSYTAAGIVAVLSHEDKVKITKAKDR